MKMMQLNSTKLIRLVTLTPFRSEKTPNITNIDGTIMSVFNAPVIRALSQGLGIPFNIIFAEGDSFGRKENGTWTGAIGMLLRGEADMTVAGLTANKERREVVNFTFPLYVSDVSFITNKPEPYTKAFAMFETFSFEVWIGVGLSLVLTSILLYYLLKKSKPYITIFTSMMANLLEKSFYFEVKRKNTVPLLIFWFLGITILTSSYKSIILSVLTFPRMVGIRDISDLAKAAKEGTVSCISYKGGIPSVRWFETDDDRLKSIGKSMRQSELQGLTGQPAFIKYSKKKAFIADRLDIITFKREYFVSDDSFSLSHLGIAYSKTFCCPRKLESIVHRIVAADLYAKTLRDREFIAQLRLAASNTDDYESKRFIPLALKDLRGPFLVLIVGHLTSCLVFLIEIYIFKKRPETIID